MFEFDGVNEVTANAAPPCGSLQPVTAEVRVGWQDALAGDEGMAQDDAGVGQETALSSAGM